MFRHNHHLHRNMNGGEQYIFKFANDYGASVVRHSFSYGHEKGLWELAVFFEGHLCYSTPIADDVIGWLSPSEVDDILDKIEALQ